MAQHSEWSNHGYLKRAIYELRVLEANLTNTQERQKVKDALNCLEGLEIGRLY